MPRCTNGGSPVSGRLPDFSSCFSSKLKVLAIGGSHSIEQHLAPYFKSSRFLTAKVGVLRRCGYGKISFLFVQHCAARFLAAVPDCGRLAVRAFGEPHWFASNSVMLRHSHSGVTKEILPCFICYKAPPKFVSLLPSGIAISGNHRLV